MTHRDKSRDGFNRARARITADSALFTAGTARARANVTCGRRGSGGSMLLSLPARITNAREIIRGFTRVRVRVPRE